MGKKLTDEEIIALYKTSADEQPPASLDEQILTYASQQSRQTDKAGRRWWPYLSLAASVAALALLAPWRWVDQSLQPDVRVAEPSPSVQSQSIQPPSVQSNPVQLKPVQSKQMQAASDAGGLKSAEQEQERQLMQSLPADNQAGRMEPAVLPLRMKSAPEADSEALDQLVPAVPAAFTAGEQSGLPEQRSPFAEIEALLGAGQNEAARERLRKLLAEQPALEAAMPDRLKVLLETGE